VATPSPPRSNAVAPMMPRCCRRSALPTSPHHHVWSSRPPFPPPQLLGSTDFFTCSPASTSDAPPQLDHGSAAVTGGRSGQRRRRHARQPFPPSNDLASQTVPAPAFQPVGWARVSSFSISNNLAPQYGTRIGVGVGPRSPSFSGVERGNPEACHGGVAVPDSGAARGSLSFPARIHRPRRPHGSATRAVARGEQSSDLLVVRGMTTLTSAVVPNGEGW
jgi:hypothetical protein